MVHGRLARVAGCRSIERSRADASRDDRAARRCRGRDRYVSERLRTRYGSFGIGALGGEEALAERVAAEPETSGFLLVDTLGREIEDALAKPR